MFSGEVNETGGFTSHLKTKFTLKITTQSAKEWIIVQAFATRGALFHRLCKVGPQKSVKNS